MSVLIDEQELVGTSDFFQMTVDCLRSHIAILNDEGTIIAVNASWNRFATSNGLAEKFCGPGANYLRSCDQATGDCSDEAKVVADGIRDVIAKRLEYFYLEYPCHSPTEQRWFSVRVTQFEIRGSVKIVVTHDNITQRKLAELELKEANRILGSIAITDALTGISNRRRFEITFAAEWNRHRRLNTSLAVAFVDIDYFKLFNDHYGHLAGDACLKAIATTIQEIVGRADGFVARYGGEEFVIVLPGKDTDDATSVLKEILGGVRDQAIPHCASLLPEKIVSISIGCAVSVPDQRPSATSLLDSADRALYEAKVGGRNQLICGGEVSAEELKGTGVREGSLFLDRF